MSSESEQGDGPSLLGRLREWFRQYQAKARVADVTQLPPAADGRQYRYEIALKLDDGVDSPPDEDDVREIADGVLGRVEEIDHPDWPSADEIYIQIYAPDWEIGSGACGTAHWVDGEYEAVEARDFMF